MTVETTRIVTGPLRAMARVLFRDLGMELDAAETSAVLWTHGYTGHFVDNQLHIQSQVIGYACGYAPGNPLFLSWIDVGGAGPWGSTCVVCARYARARRVMEALSEA